MRRARYYDELPWPLRWLVRVGLGQVVLRYEKARGSKGGPDAR